MDLPASPARPDPAPIVMVDPDEDHQRELYAALDAAHVVNPVVRARSRADLPGLVHRPVLVLTAATLPDGTCLDILDEVRTRLAWRRTPVIVLGQHDDEELIARAHERGAAGYLSWPVAASGLVGVLQGMGLPWALAPVS